MWSFWCEVSKCVPCALGLKKTKINFFARFTSWEIDFGFFNQVV